MAKERKKKKKRSQPTVTEDMNGVSVHVSVGAKCSVDYSSLDFNLGATTNVLPGESVEEALERTREQVIAFFTEHEEATYDVLHETVDRRKRR